LLTFVLYLNHRKLIFLIFSGLFLGLTTLCRSVALPISIFITLYLWFGAHKTVIQKAKHILLFLGCFILVIMPWAIRNYAVHHTFISVDLIGKIDFLIGNYQYTPLNRAWDAHITQIGERSWSYPLREQGLYDKMTEVQRMDWAFRQGVEFIIQHLVLTLKRGFIKFFNFWELERIPFSMAVRGLLGDSNKTVLALLAMSGWLFYLAIIFGSVFSFIYFFKNNVAVNSFFLLVITYFALIHSIIFGHPRYHLPLIPILVIYGSHAILNIKEVWNRKNSMTFSLAVLCCFFFLFVWSRQIYIHLNDLYLV